MIVIVYVLKNVFYFYIRVAEWSKAPDSRSGPRMWAWVRIPSLIFFEPGSCPVAYGACPGACLRRLPTAVAPAPAVVPTAFAPAVGSQPRRSALDCKTPPPPQ